MTYEGTAHGNPPHKPRRPSYEEVITDGERIVSYAIVIIFTFMLVVYLLLTQALPTTHYKDPCTPTVDCEVSE